MPPSKTSNVCFFANIPPTATEEEITDTLKKYGKLERIIYYIGKSDAEVGWAFVKFERRDVALKVRENLDNSVPPSTWGTAVGGLKLVVQLVAAQGEKAQKHVQYGHWTEYRTDEGVPYYHNCVSDEKTWIKPAEISGPAPKPLPMVPLIPMMPMMPMMPTGMPLPPGMQMPPGAQLPPGMQMPPGAQLPPGMQLPAGMQMPPNMQQMAQMPPGMQLQPGQPAPSDAAAEGAAAAAAALSAAQSDADVDNGCEKVPDEPCLVDIKMDDVKMELEDENTAVKEEGVKKEEDGHTSETTAGQQGTPLMMAPTMPMMSGDVSHVAANMFEAQSINAAQSTMMQVVGPPGANLFVYNVPPIWEEKFMEQYFTPYGKILSCRITRDPQTGAPRGYGFVSYESPTAAAAAIVGLHGFMAEGKPLKVALKKGEEHLLAMAPANVPRPPAPAVFMSQPSAQQPMDYSDIDDGPSARGEPYMDSEAYDPERVPEYTNTEVKMEDLELHNVPKSKSKGMMVMKGSGKGGDMMDKGKGGAMMDTGGKPGKERPGPYI